eukprot:m.26021 g.26021  ORF g.26021 m.26021 type:complete len:202 (+) comp11653_c0_seq1:98-703(+)
MSEAAETVVASASTPVVSETTAEPEVAPKPTSRLASAAAVKPQALRHHLAIASAFQIFDHEHNNTIDVRELGTVIRSLGCCPSDAELREIILECQEEEPTGFIAYERFEPVISRILEQSLYQSASLEELRQAFIVLGGNEDGTMDSATLTTILTEEGEGLDDDEIDEMLTAAVDPDTKQVYFEEHSMIMQLSKDAYGRLAA